MKAPFMRVYIFLKLKKALFFEVEIIYEFYKAL